MTKRNNEMLSSAIVLATNAHAGQYDKGGKSYILHCLAVMYLLNSNDDELNSAAILHDIIEDTKTTYQDLVLAGMSDRVIKIVRNMTKQPGQTYEEYKQQVLSDRDTMLVKRADLTHNSDIRRLKGVSEKDIDRMAKYHRFFLEINSKLENEK